MLVPKATYAWSDGAIKPRPRSLAYRAALICVAVMMVILPAIYVGLCCALAFGVYWFATNETFLLGYHQAGIMTYLITVVAGCLTLLFMVKPLFARPKSVQAHVELTEADQPDLFAFIREICARIHAPMPARVLVDNQVNASASLGQGLPGFFRNRLVLTIGLPLAQGLTTRQLGGVIAHEFGHFTQSAALRLNSVIRSVNGWFHLVIYHRDRLDTVLVAWSKRGHLYSVAASNVARALVWLARKILWSLMMAGHAVSAYMMRQMEYDADYYEHELVGTKTFRETFLRMKLIGLGSHIAQNHLQAAWKQGQLVDSLPSLGSHFTNSIPDQQVQAFAASFEKDKTHAKWSFTHPTDYERLLGYAHNEHLGFLTGDEKAVSLFHDFADLARKVTLLEYSERFRLPLEEAKVIPTEKFLAQTEERSRCLRELKDFLGSLLSDSRYIFPGQATTTQPLGDRASRFEEISRLLEEREAFLKDTCSQIETARTKRAQALAAQALISIGIKVDPANFGLANLAAATISSVHDSSSQEIKRLESDLAPSVALASEKLHLVCAIGGDRQTVEPDPKIKERLLFLEKFLIAVQPINSILNAYRKPLFEASLYVNNYQAAKDKKTADRLFLALTPQFKQALDKIESIGQTISFPLPDKNQYKSLDSYFAKDNYNLTAAGQYSHLQSIYERFSFVYMEVLLEILRLSQGSKSHA